MTTTCACGSVTVTLHTKPDFIYDCDCSLCRKTGGAWGYFRSAEVVTVGDTAAFSRADKKTPAVEIHSCARCSATTHFVLHETYQAENPGVDQVGVNMRLFDPRDLQGIKVYYPNGRDWSGTGPFGFRREAMKITPDNPW